MADPRVIVLVSANAEWRAVKEILVPPRVQTTPMGETFVDHGVTWFHGGWGKISAAATTQYVIDRYQPDLLVNLGTCGGFEGRIERGTLILVERTIIYDILEQMSDPQDAIDHYSTDLDLSWLAEPLPGNVQRGLLVSADRDLLPADIPMLVDKYGAMAADWESGAIAWVARKNSLKCLILRGVTDLIGMHGGEAYNNIQVFHENTTAIMKVLISSLPDWLTKIE
jgi:adenosylhomocysteine nucleosidase